MKRVIMCLILFTSAIFSQNYPNDPKYQDGSQWHIYNDYSGNTALRNDADIDILEAWDITKGDPDVVIAILDSGIPMANGQLSHDDLKNTSRINCGVSKNKSPKGEKSNFDVWEKSPNDEKPKKQGWEKPPIDKKLKKSAWEISPNA